MRTSHIIIILGIIIGSSVIFVVLQPVSQEQNLSKQCDIPHDVNFVDERSMIAGSGQDKSNYSIAGEFSIFYTIPIDDFRVDESNP